ncbi:hypothetical protein FA15DRAFT_667636 [Coprinopsis marcescibilis]|uniref:DNA helicase n=1 Tax=Coprinopsis marcescibilis TaxID=230819 RepID=A0A5C3L1D7_COPMA|nr:hypothetical protein FA15DRAFT_667636 [Coprinopsis marcescibilis]
MSDSMQKVPVESRSTRSTRIKPNMSADVGLNGSAVASANSHGRSSSPKRQDIVVDAEEILEAEKAAILMKKRTELDQVFNRHDDLVREKFHMDHYQTLLTFHPVSAKADTSQVFQQYKANFDLVGSTPVAGPSRQTRRAHSERMKLVTSVPPATSLSSSAPGKSASSKRKGKPDGFLHQEIWDILASAREGKGKGREWDTTPAEMDSVSAKRSPKKKVKGATGPLTGRVNNGKSPSIGPSAHSPIVEESVSIAVRRRPQGVKRVHSSVSEQAKDRNMADPSSSDKKRQKTKDPSAGPVRLDSANSVSAPTGRTLRGDRGRHHSITVTSKQPLAPQHVSQNQPCVSPATPSHKLKRIKLIVRRPPRVFTNPGQIPPPPQHGGSLTQLVSSIKTNGVKEVNEETLQRQVLKEAGVRKREADFRRQERFIPRTDILFGTKIDVEAPLPEPYRPPKRTTTDLWDAVITAVVANGKARQSKKVPTGRQIAAQIASRIQAYWEGQAAKKEKLRAQEEKRLRALAKSTIKMVVAEWKRAVFHIREQERLKEEAEERRRGHAHLDAILDQSGQILETQQFDLRRRDASSRGSSVSERLFNWGNDSDDEDEDESEGDGDEELTDGEGKASDDGISERTGRESGMLSEDESEEDENDGIDSRMLLMDSGTFEASRPETSSSEIPAISIVIPKSRLTEGQDSDDDSAAVIEDLVAPDPETSPIEAQTSDMLSELLDPRPRSTPPALHEEWQTSDVLEEFGAPVPESTPSREPHSLPASSEHASSSLNRGGRLEVGRHLSASSPSTATSNLILDDMGDEESAFPGDTTITDINMQTQDQDIQMNNTTAIRDNDEDEEGEDELALSTSQQTPKHLGNPIPSYLRPFAVTQVDRSTSQIISPPSLLRGILRPYQQSGMEWLASLHTNNLNGILADEMGLGKTIQTIALLAHLACDHGIWGPHLIIVPTSVLLNWEMEFKKFLPGFKVLSYHGSTKRRKELRQGWMDKHHFNVCITSYTLASKDQHIFKRKAWYYMILDEAHMIKNFRSQRWSILLMFRSFRRLLLTGTPLQNNLTELWALLQFLMSGTNFANLKEFGDWFANPLEKAVEMGDSYDEDTMQRVSKLHTVLRPYLLRRLKRDVEKELPSKYEHLVLCPLSKRQRFLYDEFMSRAQTKHDLTSGVYQKIANILMQLRKVCNHPDLFEVRPIVTSFAMSKSAVADFEIKELLVRRRWLEYREESVNLDVLGFRFIDRQNVSRNAAEEFNRLNATTKLPYYGELSDEPPSKDTRTVAGFRKYSEYLARAKAVAHWSHVGYLNQLRCSEAPLPEFSQECISKVRTMYTPLLPLSCVDWRLSYLGTTYLINAAVSSYEDRAAQMSGYIDRFAFVTPPVVALDMSDLVLAGAQEKIASQPPEFDAILHRAAVKLQIAFPDPSLLQYDCGKLQRLAELLQEKKAGGHRVLIFTQMTRILDVLEIFLSFHGYLYLRLDGATKIEDRQYITERFNADSRIFCFISSSRSGGVGINLTGADTVVFYDSDFNPQMDRQCEDRAHRIGQIRDVHIYRFVSQHTVEEAMLRKANQKRSLDDLVIQKGEFDWRTLFKDENALTKALGDCDDVEDAHAAAVATREAFALEGADEFDFMGENAGASKDPPGALPEPSATQPAGRSAPGPEAAPEAVEQRDEEEEEGGTTVDYMLAFVQHDYDFFREWRI